MVWQARQLRLRRHLCAKLLFSTHSQRNKTRPKHNSSFLHKICCHGKILLLFDTENRLYFDCNSMCICEEKQASLTLLHCTVHNCVQGRAEQGRAFPLAQYGTKRLHWGSWKQEQNKNRTKTRIISFNNASTEESTQNSVVGAFLYLSGGPAGTQHGLIKTINPPTAGNVLADCSRPSWGVWGH